MVANNKKAFKQFCVYTLVVDGGLEEEGFIFFL